MQPIVPLLRVHARYWLRHKLQAALCVAGVALGVALFCAIRLSNEGALDAFAGAVDAFMGKATHRVFSPAGAGIPEALFVRLARSPGVLAASPLLEDRIVVAGSPVRVLGIDPISDAAFRSAPFISGPAAPGAVPSAAPAAASAPASGSPLSVLLSTPRAALVPEGLARRLGVRPGDRFPAQVRGRGEFFTVAGVFSPPASQADLLNGTIVLDVATDQEVFGKRGSLDAIRLVLAPGAAAGIARALPAGLALEPVGRRLERVERMSRAFRLNLEVLGLFSLLVGAFLILNAATFSVVQRESLVAIERCLGAGSRAVMVSLLGEAALVGAAGGALGVLLGRLLAQRLVLGTSATVAEVILNADALPAHVALSGATWAVGIGMGVLTAVCGSLMPALETYRVPPLRALQSSRRISGQPARLIGWAAAALCCGAIGLAALALPGGSLVASLAGATAAILAGALLCPVALWLAGAASSPILSRGLGPVGLWAARQLGRSISRTGLAGASLTVALSLALAVGITVASFRHTFAIWLDQTITADLYLTLPPQRRDARFSPALLARLRAQPFVRDLAALQTRRVTIGDREVLVVAVDPAAFGRLNRVPIREGGRESALKALAAGGAWISETLAYPLQLGPGATVRVPGRDGPALLPVAAVVQNYSAPNGVIYVARAEFIRLFGAVPIREAALWLAPGTSLDAASRRVSGLAGAGSLEIERNGDLRAGAMRVFERTFAVTGLMTGLAAVIAFIAVISASAALLEERRQLIGYLRAIGVSRPRLAGAMAVEAGLLAAVCGVMSWGVGCGVSAILVYVVNRRAFGWTLQFLPGSGNYVQLLLLSVAAAWLGTLVPVYRMWRSPILAAIREE